MDEKSLTRFMKNVDKTDSCWLWTGTKINVGYGRFCFQGKQWIAHRLMYLHCHGELINDMVICHTCRNKCVNPDHLEQKSQGENMNDRLRDGTDQRGEKHNRSKLTNEQVVDIRSRKNQTQQSIADEFGVHQTIIGRILRGKRWTHI